MGWQYNPFTGELDKVGSTSASSPWDLINATALALSTTTVDSFNDNLFRAIKYHVVAYNNIESKFRTFEINILNENGTYKESISGRIGSVNFSVETFNNAGTFELQINNPNSYDIFFKLGRLILI